MNKYLASYLFSGETIFNIDKISGADIELVVAPEILKAAQESIPSSSQKTDITKSVIIEKPTKGLLIVVNTISETQKEFLAKILLSVKKDLNESDIFDNSKPTALNLAEYKEIISFGVVPNQLKIETQVMGYQLKKINHTNFLLVDTLDAIQINQNDEKRILWGALKSMFGI